MITLLLVILAILLILLAAWIYVGYLKAGAIKYINIPFTGYCFRISKTSRNKRHYDSY